LASKPLTRELPVWRGGGLGEFSTKPREEREEKKEDAVFSLGNRQKKKAN